MKLEFLKRVHVRRMNGPDEHLSVGSIADFSDEDAIWLMLKAPRAVRPIPVDSPKPDPRPEASLLPGWKVVFREGGRLQDGIVTECLQVGRSWKVQLTNGHSIAIERITSVGKADTAGKVVAAWTTREHGLTGEGKPR